MAEKLDPQKIAWLKAPETRAVMAALGPRQARFVGGAVRDALLGRVVEDIDIACSHAPEEATQRLQAAGIKVFPTGIDHGTITAIANHKAFEITTLRHDTETFGRKARVTFTDDWAADAARRDFTINALYADADGVIHDPFNGVGDLVQGLVRFIGDAEARITEDALRILRFFRFHAWYGKGNLDVAGLRAVTKLSPQLDILSAERITKEMMRLLAASRPAATLAVMHEAGVLRHILGVTQNIHRLERLQDIDLGRVDPLRRLAALLPDGGAAPRLRLSRKEAERLADMTNLQSGLISAIPDLDLLEALYRNGRVHVVDHLLLNWAGSLAAVDAPAWSGLVETAEKLKVPEFPLKGADIVAAGIEPGPMVGRILGDIERHWIVAGFPSDMAQLRAMRADAIARYRADV